MGGSVVPVGMPVDLVVHQQMAGQHLAEHALTLVARTGDRLQRFTAGVVHDVERYVEHLRHADGAVGGLALDFRRAGRSEARGVGNEWVRTCRSRWSA